MDERNRPVSDWRIERLAQGELDETNRRDLEARLGQDETAARLARLRASNEEILQRLPPALVGASLRRRLQERRLPRTRWWIGLLPVAMAAGLWAGLAPRFASDPHDHEYIGAKGVTRLHVYRAAGPGARPAKLLPAARVRPHDVLQLAYTAGDARFGAVLSVDALGVVTVHLPSSGADAVPLAGAGETNLAQSYELDDTPGFERFFLVTAPQPFALAPVLDAAHALAKAGARDRSLSLPPGLQQESLLLEKVKP